MRLNKPVSTWWVGHQQGRRPVSRWRRWLGVAVLLLVVLCAGTYRHLTNEERLKRFAERWLEDFSGGQASIDHLRLDLFHGLHLVGVALALPESTQFDPNDDSPAARRIFSCATLFLRLRPLSIITGNLIVPEIVASKPKLTLVHRMSDGVGNWEVMLQHRKRTKHESTGPLRLPAIRLRDVTLEQYRLNERGRWGGAPQIIYADAQPLADRPQVYDLKITKVIESPDTEEMTGETARLEIDIKTLAVSGSLPTMTIEELLFTASPEVNRWLDALALRGYVRPDTFFYKPDKSGRASLALRDARFSIPIDADEAGLPPEQRYLQFDAMAGEIHFDGRKARVQLEGRFRNSPLAVSGQMVLGGPGDTGLDAIGFDLNLTASAVPLPREDETADPCEVRFVRRWPRLQKFVREYDGVGPVDLAITLGKSVGASTGVQFVEGTLTPRGASGRYFLFPYRVNDLAGTVHFRPDGKVELKELAGTHGRGRVAINGLVGGYVSQFGEVDIRGEDVALDADLIGCLSERNRDLCRQFNAEAVMNLRVQLQRADAPHGTQDNPWQTIIDATFTSGSVSFAGFPYPLQDLTGHMRIAGGGFEIDSLSAARGDARVRISGSARRPDGGPTMVDLALEAQRIALDDILARALPSDARETYNRFAPAGQADLKGRIFNRAGGERIEYDLRAAIRGMGVNLPGTSARLLDAAATMRITPQRLTIESLSGKFGESTIDLQASLNMTLSDPISSLYLHSEHLLLDEALHEALPASVRATWDLFKPCGYVGLDLRYGGATAATQPAGPSESAPSTQPAPSYTVTIEPKNARAVYAAFPWPLSDITGRVVATPTRVDLQNITARHEQTVIKLAGGVDLLPDQKRVELSVDATNVTFTEALRQAVPWRLRRLWNNVKPQGTVDLSFDRLAFTVRPNVPAYWEFKGRARLDDATLAVGPELSGISGYIEAEGKVAEEFSIAGEVSLSRVKVDGRLVTDLTAKLDRPPADPIFRVNDILGQFCGGTIVGWAKVDCSPGGPTFGLSLTARDVSLGEFLNTKRKADEKPVNLKGRVQGNLDLVGRFGDPQSRRGGGKVLISQAQMFKIPMLLAILQVIHFATDDDNAFHDATFDYIIDGSELILQEIDLRGKALSMVGAGRVHTPTQGMNLTLLVGSPLRLPRMEVLSELLEGVARELMEVRVEGTLEAPQFRAELVRSVSQTLDTILNARRKQPPRR